MTARDLLVSFLVSAAASLLVALFVEWAPTLALWTVRMWVKCLPRDQADFYAELWAENIEASPQPVRKFLNALSLGFAVLCVWVPECGRIVADSWTATVSRIAGAFASAVRQVRIPRPPVLLWLVLFWALGGLSFLVNMAIPFVDQQSARAVAIAGAAMWVVAMLGLAWFLWRVRKLLAPEERLREAVKKLTKALALAVKDQVTPRPAGMIARWVTPFNAYRVLLLLSFPVAWFGSQLVSEALMRLLWVALPVFPSSYQLAIGRLLLLLGYLVTVAVAVNLMDLLDRLSQRVSGWPACRLGPVPLAAAMSAETTAEADIQAVTARLLSARRAPSSPAKSAPGQALREPAGQTAPLPSERTPPGPPGPRKGPPPTP